jgi:hypothetical protein
LSFLYRTLLDLQFSKGQDTQVFEKMSLEFDPDFLKEQSEDKSRQRTKQRDPKMKGHS